MTFGISQDPISEASSPKAVLTDRFVASAIVMRPPEADSALATRHGSTVVHFFWKSLGMNVVELPDGASMLESMGLPFSRAATRAYILAVDPMAKPLVPPYCAGTLQACSENSVEALSSPTRYFEVWATARTLPVPGSTMAAALPNRSVPSGTRSVRSFLSFFCQSRRSVVLIVRPPLLTVCIRASGLGPSSGICLR